MADQAARREEERLRHYDTKNSPFLELQTPFTTWEAVKVVLLAWTIPLRLFVGILGLLVLAAMSYVAALGWPIDQPFPKWRRELVKASRHCAGVVLFCMGFQIHVKGWHNVKKAEEVGALGVFNHISWADPITMMWLFAPSGVSKADNATIPLIGTCIRSYQNIWVPRGKLGKGGEKQAATSLNGNSSMSISELIVSRAHDRRFPMVVIAPEGTCGDGRCLLQFRTGAFVAGVPVLPVLFQYDTSRHNPAWTIINEGWHWFRLMCQFYNRMEVTILPPYIPSEPEKADPVLYANNVRSLFAKTLKLPLSDQSHKDFMALTANKVGVSLDGRRVVAPPGILDKDGFADLTKGFDSSNGKKKVHKKHS
ncbi:hypothetical protein WJX72_001238 [[Myrmecia] bisecta]|uniref:Phospholipid/glycerol acyltransferase domain-containing protein n=1 Tax=[Myrmecia] bisecta TaxID=41462 RepID=A0AAW1PC75_9CHLO